MGFNNIMTKKLTAIVLVPIVFALTGCFGDDGSWKEKYGTPELFLENVQEIPSLYLYENESRFSDTNFEVRDLIKESGPFEEIEKRSPTSQRYFTYEAFWQPATSGPNYCNMSIWDDGLIRIDHKSSLGPHGYLYFSMDEAKASRLNDFVFSKSGTI